MEAEMKQARRRMPRRVKVPLILVGILAGLLLLAQLLAAPVARPIVERRASEALGTAVRIGSLRINLFAGRIGLRDLAVENPPEAGPGRAVEVGALDLDLGLGALLRGKVVVQDLAVDRPAVYVVRGEDGRTNLERLGAKAEAPTTSPAPEEPAKPTPVRLDRLRVRDGLFVYTDRSQGEPAYEMRLEALAVTADGLSTEPAEDGAMQPIQVTGRLRSGDAEGRLNATARVAALARPLNADLDLTIEGANLAGFPLKRGVLGDLRIGRGDLLVIGRLTAKDDALTGDQTVQVRRLQLAHSGGRLPLVSLFGVPVEALNAFLLVTDGRLYVEFPLAGTVAEPAVPFDKALQRTVAAGPRRMLERAADLPGDFLAAGADLRQLIGKPIDDGVKRLFDPATWKIRTSADTGDRNVLRSTTRALGDTLRLLDPTAREK